MNPRYVLEPMGKLWGETTKFEFWLKVEVAVAYARAKMGEVPNDSPILLEKYSKVDLERIEELDRAMDHDMNAFLRAVSESVADGMRKDGLPEEKVEEVLSCLHAGLTSYDIEDTALALRLKTATAFILAKIQALKHILWEMAWRYKDAPQIGRTHLQHAEISTFGLKILRWYGSFDNHEKHLKENRHLWEVGKISGAVGTFSHLDPEIEGAVGEDLQIHMAQVSGQIVSREGIAYMISGLSHVASTLAKCAKDIEDLSRTEIQEVSEAHPRAKQGSSAMPHKTLQRFANPNKCERIFALPKMIRGFAHTASENIDIRHEQDLTHSASERIIIPGAFTLVDYMLTLFKRVMQELHVDKDRMLENIWMTGGLIFSGHVANALMDKGMPREDARELVTRLCEKAEQMKGSKNKKKRFMRAVEQSAEVRRWLEPREARGCFFLDRHLRNVDKIFERFRAEGGENCAT